MSCFINHQLTETPDCYIITLHLDQQLTKFAAEFDQLTTNKQTTLKKKIAQYLEDKFPDLKIKTVNVMLGSLLVASLPLVSINPAFATRQQQITNSSSLVYRVKKGDPLSEIAKKYNLTIQELKKANQLSTDLIYIDQQLKIPNSSEIYLVKSSDTLAEIAAKVLQLEN